jgi:hypothetical protein
MLRAMGPERELTENLQRLRLLMLARRLARSLYGRLWLSTTARVNRQRGQMVKRRALITLSSCATGAKLEANAINAVAK